MAIREVLSGVIPRSDFRAFLPRHALSSILIEIIGTPGLHPARGWDLHARFRKRHLGHDRRRAV